MTAKTIDEPAPLFRLRGELRGRQRLFELGPGEHRVGSAEECDIHLAAAGVSRSHAVLEVRSGVLFVADAASKNGTFLDERRIERAAVSTGTELRFGPVRLQVEALDAGGRLAIRFDDGPESSVFASDRTTVDGTSMLGAAVDAGHDGPKPFHELIYPEGFCRGSSSEAQALQDEIRRLARSRLPVLIHGETGVGKEMVARTLHLSSRRDGRFEAVNCAAIPADLMEAELFGVAKGAATGVEPRPGLFTRAEGGSLLLDEIGELAPALQAKLLRALQEKEIRPLGGRPRAIDVRILSATHIDLEREVGDRLRADLYYRLAGSVVEVPPLRRCREDIPAFAAFFLQRYARELGLRLSGVSAGAVSRLVAYDWPGNIRELEHQMHRLVSHADDGALIAEHDLDARIRRPRPELHAIPNLAAAPEGLESLALTPRLEALERALIREALMRTGGRLGDAAKLLEISRNGLSKKMKRLGLKETWTRPDAD